MQIRLGTRGSKLAIIQAELVKNALKNSEKDIEIELVEIKTLGDRKQGTPQASISDKKDWVHDIELAISNDSVDIAVHSGKDIPVEIEDGTSLLPVLFRANPLDAFIGRLDSQSGDRLTFADLPQGAKVGTASLRRRAQLLKLRPDLNVVEHRGNVPTRLKKMDDSDDIMGIVLASSGLDRLQIEGLEYVPFNSTDMMPAINQGMLVVQYRTEDKKLEEKLLKLVDQDMFAVWQAERAVAEVLEGDCKSAISIFAECHNNQISLAARVMSPDGVDYLEVSDSEASENAHALGLIVGKSLLEKGADRIIQQSRDF